MDDINIDDTTDLTMGQEIARSLVVSAAVSAGTLIGFVAVGLAYGKISDTVEKHRAKKKTKKIGE